MNVNRNRTHTHPHTHTQIWHYCHAYKHAPPGSSGGIMNEQDDLQIENKSLAHSPVKRTKTIVAQSARPPMCRRHACKASHSHPPSPRPLGLVWSAMIYVSLMPMMGFGMCAPCASMCNISTYTAQREALETKPPHMLEWCRACVFAFVSKARPFVAAGGVRMRPARR